MGDPRHLAIQIDGASLCSGNFREIVRISLGVTQVKWELELCGYEDAVYFGDDTLEPLAEAPGGSLSPGPRRPLDIGVEESDWWSPIYETCRNEREGHVVVAGGSYGSEGQGFVALLEASSHALLWIIHLNEVETVVEVSFEGLCIKAESWYYPSRSRWTIPIEDPGGVIIVKSHEP
jgi:hypothetical protein